MKFRGYGRQNNGTKAHLTRGIFTACETDMCEVYTTENKKRKWCFDTVKLPS